MDPVTLTKGELSELVRGELKSAGLDQLLAQINGLAKASGPGIAGDVAAATTANDRTPVKGSAVAKAVLSLVAGKGDLERSLKWATKTFGQQDAVVKALSSSDETAGGAFISEELSSDFIELLRPMSAVLSLNPVRMQMSNGGLTLPKITGGATGTWIGENANAGATEQTTGQVKLVAKKLSALTPISNDLIRRASISAQEMVANDLAAALAEAQDAKFIRGAGSDAAPRGLLYWAPDANKNDSSGTTLAQVTSDLYECMQLLEQSDVRMIRPGWIFSPRTKYFLMSLRDGNGNYAFKDEMSTGKLLGYPFRSTSQVPNTLGSGNKSEVYFADFADVVVGEATNLLLTTSDTAAYHNGSSVVAAFSLDQTVIRAILETDLVVRHPESVAVIEAVAWTL